MIISRKSIISYFEMRYIEFQNRYLCISGRKVFNCRDARVSRSQVGHIVITLGATVVGMKESNLIHVWNLLATFIFFDDVDTSSFSSNQFRNSSFLRTLFRDECLSMTDEN